jgi:hypothetical protein
MNTLLWDGLPASSSEVRQRGSVRSEPRSHRGFGTGKTGTSGHDGDCPGTQYSPASSPRVAYLGSGAVPALPASDFPYVVPVEILSAHDAGLEILHAQEEADLERSRQREALQYRVETLCGLCGTARSLSSTCRHCELAAGSAPWMLEWAGLV